MRAHILETAGEGTPLVYVPGIDGTGRYLLGTAEALARRYRLVCLRYEAEVPLPAAGDTYIGLARSIGRRLDEVGIGRCLVLTESFGGAVSLQLALDDPDRVAGLLIVNSFVHYPWRNRLAFSRFCAPLVPRPLFVAFRPLVVPRALFRPRADEDALHRFLATEPALFDAGYRRRLQMIRHLDLRPRLAEVTQPVSLFASDQDRIVPSLPAGKVMHEGLPNAEFEVLEGTGHLALPLTEEPWIERLQDLAARAAFS